MSIISQKKEKKRKKTNNIFNNLPTIKETEKLAEKTMRKSKNER